MPGKPDKLEWNDDGSALAHRVPERGTLDLRLGDQVIVRDHQAAVVAHEGRGLDVLGPGRHPIQPVNVPVLTRVLRIPVGHKAAVDAVLYFVSMKPLAGVAWGGTPVEVADPKGGRVTATAAGAMRVRVVQPLLFVNQVIGLRRVDPGGISSFLGEIVPAALRALVEEAGVAAVPTTPEALAPGLKARAGEGMLRLGVELQDLTVATAQVPGAAGAVPAAGASPWVAPIGRSAGEAGFGSPFGLTTPGTALERVRRGDDRPEGIHERRVVACRACHAEVPLTARFCPQCGHQMVLINRCPACATDLPAEARFCFQCGIRLEPA
jgi:membrane protease subunit (stomatin/prohibitin family)